MKHFYLFVAIGLFGLTSCGGGTKTDSQKTVETSLATEDGVQRITISEVQGSCEMCKARIESTALAIDGVETATWDFNTHDLIVSTSKSINAEDLSKAIAHMGHDTKMHKADDDVYNALPSCCHYRK